MRILIDAREAVRNKSGIGVVARKIISQIGARDTGIHFIVIKPRERRLFNSSLGRLFEFLWWKIVHIRFLALWHRCDYIFSLDPINTMYGKKNISIIYDLIFFVYPHWTNQWGRLWRTLLPWSINKNALLFSISAQTTSDIKRYIPTFNPGISVVDIELGFDRTIFNTSRIDCNFMASYDLPVDLSYIMFVGNAEPRRNLDSVIKALAGFNKTAERDCHLVVAGRNDSYREQIMQLAEREGIAHCVHIVGYVNDERLASFYKYALAYIYPSYYEGFGLTVIEAMACGCPVITSNTSSLKDVAGDAAILIDPADQNSITSALRKVLSDENLRKNLVEAGYRNIVKYDWDLMAETILTSLKGLNNNAHHS